MLMKMRVLVWCLATNLRQEEEKNDTRRVVFYTYEQKPNKRCKYIYIYISETNRHLRSVAKRATVEMVAQELIVFIDSPHGM